MPGYLAQCLEHHTHITSIILNLLVKPNVIIYFQNRYKILMYCRAKIVADPEKCFQESISEKLLILLRDGPCLE